MKTELTDVSPTQKTLTVEVPSETVDAEIARVARDYSKQAKIPGFRPGKVPTAIIKQRFRDQILHDVMHDLVPRVVDEALTERGLEPVDTPNIKDVHLHEGKPLTFTAAIETLPPVDPGDLSTIAVHSHPVTVTSEAVEEMLQQLRQRAAKFESVEARPVTDGDTVVVDLVRTDAKGESETHDNVSIELGSPANPPGFDANLVGLSSGEEKRFPVQFPQDYPVAELAGSELTYAVKVREIRRKVLPELDEEFAKDVGDFESLDALRQRIRTDMQADAEERARQHTRNDLLRQLASRVTFEVPASMVEREIDRRLEEFVRQLFAQNIDPRNAGIDWAQFREAQRDPAKQSVASAIMLDAIARREQITVPADAVDKEIETMALRTGRTPAAVRAEIEKEGALSRLEAALRRERAVDFALSHAKMTADHPQSTGDQ